MFEYGEPRKKWIAYDNGSYEPVDPQGDLRKKPRDERRMDWWVEDKTPDWRPDAYADTKRGNKARKELGGGTKTMEIKPDPFFSKQPEFAPTKPLVQPQHDNTGHASARLGGPEDGKVTLLGSESEEKAPAKVDQNEPNFARDKRNLQEAEKGLNRHDAGKDFHDLPETKRKDRVPPLVIGGKGPQSGKGPLNSQDRLIQQAKKQAQGQTQQEVKDVRNELQKEIKRLREQKGSLKGKERTKLLKRLDQLKAALKVLPRGKPGAPLILLNPFDPSIHPELFETGDDGYYHM